MSEELNITPSPKSADLGLDSLLEDLFGLNIRGVKTIWTLFRRPHAYFVAAKTHNWQDRFTPSFRVWFALMAIGTFFTFIWAGDKSTMLGLYSEMMSEVVRGANMSLAERGKVIDPAGFDPTLSAKALVKWTQLITPFTYFFFFILLAAIYQAWGEKLNFVVRLRYVFAIIVPGTLLGFILAMASTWVPKEIFQWVNLSSLIIMFASYYCVAYYGPYRNVTGSGRLGRSLAITLLIIIAVMLASVLAMLIGIFPAVKSTFPDAITLVKEVTPAP